MAHRPTKYLPIILNSAFFILHFLLAPPASSQPSPVDRALAQATNGLNRFVLDNGLIVLIKEEQAAPLVSIQAWIRTGSANEQEYLGGGLSHGMEHMIFKGTPTRPPGAIAQAVDATGGAINAYTAGERTVFFADLPARHWRTGLEVLADALRNAAFPEEEWQREQDVIRREMAMDQDNPDRQLSRLLWETAYRAHPYRTPVIGYPDVFATLTRQDLRTFFQRHYAPNNIILVLAGAVRTAEAEAAIRELFGGWPRQAGAPAPLPAEPEQIRERLTRRTGAYAVTRVAICWHTVNTTHPDAPDLDLLAALAGNGRSSRLVREIKDQCKLAHEISAWSFTPLDPGLFGIAAVCDPGQEAALIEAIQSEVRRWANEPFARDELEKARRLLLVETLAQFQTAHGQADNFAAGEFYAGSPSFFQTYLQRLERVSPASLRAVARKYLQPDNRTVAVLAPESEQSIHGGQSNAVPGTACHFESRLSGGRDEESRGLPAWWRSFCRLCGIRMTACRETDVVMKKSDPAPSAAGQVEKIALTSGVPLLLREDHKLPLIWLTAVCGGGLSLENESDNGITSLMAELLTRGARGRRADAIARTVESLGASLTAFAGQNSFGLRVQGLSRDAPALMEILADCLLAPDLAPEELALRKPIQLAMLQQQRESPLFIAQEALRQTLFPGHPYRFVPEGNRQAIEALTADQVRAWHAKTVVASNTVLAIFGDIAADRARELAEKYFKTFPTGISGQLQEGHSVVRHGVTQRRTFSLRSQEPCYGEVGPCGATVPPEADALPGGRIYPQPELPQRVVRHEPREQAIIMAGFPGVDLRDPRNDALNLLQQALSGLSSELMLSIRDRQGLAYYTGAIQQPGVMPGYFALYAGTRPDALAQVEDLMRQEIRRGATQGLGSDELERARNKLIANHAQRLQLNGELALECALNELYGRGYAYSFETEQRLRALTAESVREAAAAILNTNKIVISVVEPGKEITK